MEFTELKHIDIEILKYIAKHQPISKSKVLKKFPEKKYSTEYRINLLMNDYIFEESETKDYSGRKIIVVNRPLGIYTLNKNGSRFFQDIEKTKIINRIEFLKNLSLEIMRSVFCPVIVSLITTVLATTVFKDFLKSLFEHLF